MKIYRIQTSHGRLCIDVNNDGYVIDASPIADWMRGKHLSKIKDWAEKKGVCLEQMYRDNRKGETWDYKNL